MDDTGFKNLTQENLRKGFIIKVYVIVALQLACTCGIIWAMYYYPEFHQGM
jgi:FtsH-binding integral membrane protein